MKEQILSALGAVPVRDLSRAEWITVGMALKEEGFPCSVWDSWSQDDSRYHPGECEKKWASFHGSSNPVRGGTIVQMAKDRGWQPADARNAAMGWNDEIEYDGVPAAVPEAEVSPAEELAEYIRTLFRPDDHVGYVTQDVYWDGEDQKWAPKRGAYDQTAKELLDSLEKHPDDLGMTVGDWKPEAGAWIRFNPLDGRGVKQENVTAFRYALVESDTLSVEEQDELYRNLELPVAALVYSGGKSLHLRSNGECEISRERCTGKDQGILLRLQAGISEDQAAAFFPRREILSGSAVSAEDIRQLVPEGDG